MTKMKRFLVGVVAVAAVTVGVVGAGAPAVSAAPAAPVVDCRIYVWPTPAGCGQSASYRDVRFPALNAVWSPRSNAAVNPDRVCATSGAGDGWVRVDPVLVGSFGWALGVERGPSPGAGYRGTLTSDRRTVGLGHFAAGECKRVQLRSLQYGATTVNVTIWVKPATWPFPEPPASWPGPLPLG